MEYVVDVQGFEAADNEFVFKEVAIAAPEDDPTPSVYSFKSPHRWDDHDANLCRIDGKLNDETEKILGVVICLYWSIM